MTRLTRRQATLALATLFASTLVPARPAAAEETTAVPAGHWIDVNLDAHTVTAFDGPTAVRTIPMTSGKPGFETPTGTFYIFSRVLEETMTSESFGVPRDAPEGYNVEHVRYVQYFASGGYALHANYWAADEAFGQWNTSHGCVSMREPYAAFLWEFAGYDTPVIVRHGGLPVKVSTDVDLPDMRGATIADVRAKLAALGLPATEHTRTMAGVAAGTVVEQEPAGGKVKPGSTVTLTVAEAPKPRVPGPVRPPEGNNAWVPDLVGVLESDAHARVAQAGLSDTYVNYQTEADLPESAREFFRSIPPGCVLSTTPPQGQWQFKGSPVALAVRKP